MTSDIRSARTRFILNLWVFATLLGVSRAADAAAQIAPDSIAGKVYHDSSWFQGYSDAQTIVFENATRFTYLARTANQNKVFRRPGIIAPKPDGDYIYTRLDNQKARLTLRFDNGTTETREFVFATPTGGMESNFIFDRTFYLTDLSEWKTSAARNVSVRAKVDRSGQVIIGFIVPERKPSQRSEYYREGAYGQEVLIRVVGPSLRQFGLNAPWEDPDFQLYRNNEPYSSSELHYDNWSDQPPDENAFGPPPNPKAGLTKAGTYVSAFPLIDGSKDAAGIFRLGEGNYTVVCQARSPDDAGGDVLVEVYFLP